MMFNKEEYIKEFVEAGVALDSEKMVELSHKVQDMPLEQRIELIEKIHNELKDKEGVDEDLLKEFEQTIGLLKFAEEIQQKSEDSAGEEGKDTSEPKEATQDVAADTSATEAESKDEAEVEGNAPAEEEKEEK